MNVNRIFGAGIFLWLVGQAWLFLTCGWLFNWVYEIPPLIWNSKEYMMSSSTLIWSNVIGIFTAILFVAVYALFYKGIPGKGARKGMIYGFAVWIIAPLSGMIGMPIYMSIAKTVIIYWIINELIKYLIFGAIVGVVYKPKYF